MTVTVFGLGFVGLTTALGFAEYGHRVYGIEADQERLETIRSGKLPFLEPGLGDALRRHLDVNFFPTQALEEALSQSSVICYCVGTPYGADGQADLSYLYAAMKQTLEAICGGGFRVLVVKSTVPPGTTKGCVVPFLHTLGENVPERFGVANNPEFLREGHCWEDFMEADRIVLGVSDSRTEAMLRELYRNSGIPLCCVSPHTAEFIKYLSNSVLACLISYANEMSRAAEAIGGIDVVEAFRILHLDKRWQTGSIRDYFYPGCGYGGYCLPKDTNAFYARTKDSGFDGQILKNTIRLNDEMPEVTARRIIRAAGEDRETCIGILGLSFNPGSDDVRDTPSAKIIRALNEAGYRNIVAYDPVAMEEFQAHYQLDCQCADTYDKLLEQAGTVAITTAWPMFKDVKTRTNAPVVDCRFML